MERISINMKRLAAIILSIAVICCQLTPSALSESNTLTLPSFLTSIEEEAFLNNTSLSSIVIPDGVIDIGSRAFAGCMGLKTVFIPSSVTHIGEDAIPAEVQPTIWGESGSYAQSYAEGHNIPFRSTSTVTPAGICLSMREGKWAVTGYIGENDDIIIPNEVDGYFVASIEEYAFANCETLTSVLIPDTVSFIDDLAFLNNPSLYMIQGRPGTCAETIAQSLSVLFVNPYVCIYSLPVQAHVVVQENASFYLEADNVEQYRWQVYEEGQDDWTFIVEGVASDGTLTVPYDAGNTSKQYRCMLVGSMGDIVYTNTVGITYYPSAPQRIELTAPKYLAVSSSYTLQGAVYPEDACQILNWTSSNPAAVVVNQNGVITGVDEGHSRITAMSVNGVVATVMISTTNTLGTTVIPERITPLEELDTNMARIEDIHVSALEAVDSLVRTGEITSSEATERKVIINRAFSMQAFPWMTLAKQEYWSRENAHKRFLPGNVYYGMPYIQHGNNNNYDNRQYNVEKALSENRFYDSGEGYYILNQNRLLNGFYVGNDCSAYVGMCYFGLNHPASFIRTGDIATSKYYKDITYPELRPCDILVRAASHTLMFLYWTDADRTQGMFIEQGGTDEYGTTICSIRAISNYKTYYKPRRRADFN